MGIQQRHASSGSTVTVMHAHHFHECEPRCFTGIVMPTYPQMRHGPRKIAAPPGMPTRSGSLMGLGYGTRGFFPAAAAAAAMDAPFPPLTTVTLRVRKGSDWCVAAEPVRRLCVSDSTSSTVLMSRCALGAATTGSIATTVPDRPGWCAAAVVWDCGGRSGGGMACESCAAACAKDASMPAVGRCSGVRNGAVLAGVLRAAVSMAGFGGAGGCALGRRGGATVTNWTGGGNVVGDAPGAITKPGIGCTGP